MIPKQELANQQQQSKKRTAQRLTWTTMKHFVPCCLGLLLLLSLMITQHVSGKEKQVEVAGGREALQGELPYAIGLKLKRQSYIYCGGAFITERHIITAAHCFDADSRHPGDYTEPHTLEVVAGRVNLDDEDHGDIYELASIIKHEQYDERTLFNDVAIVELARNVTFSSDLNKLYLYSGTDLPLQTVLTVNGWGYINKLENTLPRVMRTVTVPVVPGNSCTRHGAFDPQIMICAGAGTGQDSCAGDSGGSLTRKDENGNWVAVGVVSFGGTPCGANGVIGSYTKISHYIPWITGKLPDYNLLGPSDPIPSPSAQPVPSPSVAVASSAAQSIPTIFGDLSGISLPFVEQIGPNVSTACQTRASGRIWLILLVTCIFCTITGTPF